MRHQMSLVIQQGVQWALSLIIFSLSTTIALVQYSFNQYPEASRVVLIILAVYIGYLFIVQIVKSGIRLIWFLVRMTVYLIILLTVLAVYFRGTRFFTNDMSLVYDLGANYKGENVMDYMMQRMQNFAVDSIFRLNGLDFPTSNEKPKESGESKQTENIKPRKPRQKPIQKPNKQANKESAKQAASNFQVNALKAFKDYGIDVDDEFLELMNEQYAKYADSNDLNQFLNNLMDGYDRTQQTV